MKNMVKLLSGATIILSTFLSGIASAQEFSADMVSTTKDGTFTGKIFVSKDKVRMEVPESITITRMDKRVAWMLMPGEKMYLEQPFDPRNAVATSENVSGEIERKFIGQEMLDTKMTNKYRVVYETEGIKETIFQWIDTASEIPVKTAAADGSWTMEYKNLKIGAQPDSLFEIPAGYQKFSYEMPSMEGMLEGAE